jgi:hypothetical protein
MRNMVMFLPKQKGCITLALESTIFTQTNSDIACHNWDPSLEGWQSVLNLPLPAPGVSSLDFPVISPTVQGMHINYDILGLTYWMLSRQEEIGRTDLDEHGRFPATASHAFKNGYLERPVVDEWLHILGQVIQRVWHGIELKQHLFSIKVSHDVDVPSRYGFRNSGGLIRAIAGDFINRQNFKSILTAPLVRLNSKTQLHPADPANTFDWIMDSSERHGLKSAFYFMCGKTNSRDADYNPGHPAIRHLMRRIYHRGHEIGLHPSYGTYQNQNLIRQEGNLLRQICAEEKIYQEHWGGRMHYLRWENPTTLRGWAYANMS